VKQKPQEILDGFPRIFVRYDENKTRSFGHEEYLEVSSIKFEHRAGIFFDRKNILASDSFLCYA